MLIPGISHLSVILFVINITFKDTTINFYLNIKKHESKNRVSTGSGIILYITVYYPNKSTKKNPQLLRALPSKTMVINMVQLWGKIEQKHI